MPRVKQKETRKASWSKENMLVKPFRTVNLLHQRRNRSLFHSLHYKEDFLRSSRGFQARQNAVFRTEQQEAIANHAKLLANLFCGLNPAQMQRTAFESVGRNEIKPNFINDSRTAGKTLAGHFRIKKPIG
jgi:hypothetical protein